MSEKVCPRCKKEFECNSKDIAKCNCNTLTLSNNLKYFLSKTSYECLCNQCLDELEVLTKESKMENFPLKRTDYTEGKHFYIENELFVFTEYFHMVKGECCRNNCRHCAYGYNQ